MTQAAVHPRDGFVEGHFFLPRFLVEVRDTIVDPKQGMVYTPDGAFIAESSAWPPSKVFDSWPAAPRRFRALPEEGPLIVLPSSGFYHWLIEDLPSVLTATQNAPTSAALLLDPTSSPFVLEFAKNFGMRVVEADGPVKVKRLLMRTRGEDVGWPHPNDVLQLKNLARRFSSRPHPDDGDLQVYVSRAASRRGLRHEREIEHELESQGWVVARMECMTLSEQIDITSRAGTLAGPHGAGLSHAAWMREGARLIEFFDPTYVVPCYSRLAVAAGLEYRCALVQRDVSSTEFLRLIDRMAS